jgi:hypothetical protein
MADEKLKITVGTDEFIRKMNEVQKSIQDTKKAMDDLYATQGKGFKNMEQATQYENNMKALKKELTDVTDEEKKLLDVQQSVTKKTDEFGEAAAGLGKKLGLAAIAITLVTKLVREVIAAFKDTVFGANALTYVGEVWKQIGYNIATANLNMTQWNMSFVKAIANGKAINELRKEERKSLIESATLQAEYGKLYYEASDRQKTVTERFKDYTAALAKHKEVVASDIALVNIQLAQVELAISARGDSNKALDQEAQLLAKRKNIIAQGDLQERRLLAQIGVTREAMFKKWEDEIEANLKKQDEWKELSQKLIDDYDKSMIDSLTGKKKLEAQRDFGIKQIKEIRDQLAKLGPLTADQMKMLQTMADNVWKAYYKEFAEEAKEKKATPEQQEAISKALLGNIPELEGLQKMTQNTIGNIQQHLGANKMIEEFSIWKLIGIDPESDEGKKAIEGIQKVAGKVSDALQETLQMRVDIAQRERELLDTKISETQREIELEAELYKEGFANNLTARKAYLEELKVERNKALADELKAARQQQIAQQLIQTANILTGVSEIIAVSAKYPIVGLIMAVASIASLFAIWSQAKAKTLELGEGGSGTETGIVTGKKHSQGGERFLDHVDVERDEMWGVLNPRASHKYGDIFHEMVSSFNRDEMPQFITPSVSNNVRVDNNGPNSRLDRVIKEQEKMNMQLKQGQLYTIGNKRIIKTGNNIRIIG